MRAAFLLLAPALLMAGCHKGASIDDQPALDNVENIDDAVPIDNAVMPPMPEVANVANASNASNVAAPPPKIGADQQTRDDADATGMTARLPDEEGTLPGQTENQTRPAD